jgi:hypothetical protein
VVGQDDVHVHVVAVRLALKVGPGRANDKPKSTADRKSDSTKKHIEQCVMIFSELFWRPSS